jgi:hypothetical protein
VRAAFIPQAGAPFSAPLRRLEDLTRSHIHTVVDMLLSGTLSPLQRGVAENVIISKVRAPRPAAVALSTAFATA